MVDGLVIVGVAEGLITSGSVSCPVPPALVAEMVTE